MQMSKVELVDRYIVLLETIIEFVSLFRMIAAVAKEFIAKVVEEQA